MEYDREKFKQLVLHVIWRTNESRDFGATKLNKVLWFAEARAFESLGKVITGESYVRQQFGPVPLHIVEICNELVREGLISASDEPVQDHVVRHYQALEPPDLLRFSREELHLVDYWIRHIDEDHTAGSISELSHSIGWRIARMGEVLPPHAYLAGRIRPPDTDEMTWARSEAERLGIK